MLQAELEARTTELSEKVEQTHQQVRSYKCGLNQEEMSSYKICYQVIPIEQIKLIQHKQNTFELFLMFDLVMRVIRNKILIHS